MDILVLTLVSLTSIAVGAVSSRALAKKDDWEQSASALDTEADDEGSNSNGKHTVNNQLRENSAEATGLRRRADADPASEEGHELRRHHDAFTEPVEDARSQQLTGMVDTFSEETASTSRTIHDGLEKLHDDLILLGDFLTQSLPENPVWIHRWLEDIEDMEPLDKLSEVVRILECYGGSSRLLERLTELDLVVTVKQVEFSGAEPNPALTLLRLRKVLDHIRNTVPPSERAEVSRIRQGLADQFVLSERILEHRRMQEALEAVKASSSTSIQELMIKLRSLERLKRRALSKDHGSDTEEAINRRYDYVVHQIEIKRARAADSRTEKLVELDEKTAGKEGDWPEPEDLATMLCQAEPMHGHPTLEAYWKKLLERIMSQTSNKRRRRFVETFVKVRNQRNLQDANGQFG